METPATADRASLAAPLRELGYVPGEAVPGPELEALGLRLAVREERVWLDDGEHSEPIVRLPGGAPAITEVVWVKGAPGERRVAVEIAYDGVPLTRAVHVVDVAERAVALWKRRAYALHVGGEPAAALGLWRRALALDAGDPDLLYNVACALARLGAGHMTEAIAYLARALERDGERLRPVAWEDRDLAALRERHDVRALLLDRPGPGSD
jgi:tetratricopeptide (TPR) repeat protein